MPNEFDKLAPLDRLRAENEFLRFKLMLENGAEFKSMPGAEFSPQIENHFLNYIVAFEKQAAHPVYTTVFKKIGEPNVFAPAASVPDADIESTLEKLFKHLGKFGITVSVCSPNVSARELYRFIVEELFQQHIDDINMPGMIYNFIYDEFHPDAVYDNTMLVEDDLLRDIFGKNELFFRVHYAKDGFLFNGHIYTDWSDYEMKVQRFKSLFDEIALEQSAVSSCLVDGNRCLVTGEYKAVGVTGGQRSIFQGSFTVKLEKGYLDYWEFIEINLAGFSIE